MSNLPGMAYRCHNDPSWTMDFVSEGALELTGYRPEDLIGNRTISFAELIHPFDRDPVWNEVQTALKENRPFRLLFRIRTAQEKEKWVWEQGRGVCDADGQLRALEGFITDTTDRKNAEEALRSSEAKYRTLVENLSQTIFLKDRDLRFVAVNQPFCRNLGRTEQEIIGKTDFDFFPEELAEKYRADDRRVLQEKHRLDIEEQNPQHGRILTVQTVKTPVLNDHGEAVGVLGIFWDVTDQRNMEAQLRQAHKMEAVGQLAGGIAHDFNNLLTGILGNLALALVDLPDSHPCRELLTSAETAGLRAAELTRQLLGFSRRTPLLPRPVDLNASIDETVRLLRRTFDPRVDVEIRSAPNIWPIQADAGQMGQVLMNLCLNSRDAMPEGGKLTLETSNVRLDGDAASRTLDGRPGDFVHLQVSDSGSGMQPEVLERIFEPFFTTKEPGKGTGLGLAMVFGIVKQHEGWIECHSDPGKGTRFDIYLPRLVQKSTTATTSPALDGNHGGHETILLADDEEVVGRLGQTILERHGYRVLQAIDGIEAVELYRERAADIDLVILDLSMPRLSGADTLRELRKVNPTVKVLISSGYSSEDDLRNFENEGALGFVAKPYRPAELARRVRAALDLKAMN
jgi:two-component system cell cycle sensor histidine kinase/response regulator CckA